MNAFLEGYRKKEVTPYFINYSQNSIDVYLSLPATNIFTITLMPL